MFCVFTSTEYDDVEDDSGDEADDEGNNGEEQVTANRHHHHRHPMEAIPYPGTHVHRVPNPVLPETVTVLTTNEGCKVYVIGTAHFSENSQDDVSKVSECLCSEIFGIISLVQNFMKYV